MTAAPNRRRTRSGSGSAISLLKAPVARTRRWGAAPDGARSTARAPPLELEADVVVVGSGAGGGVVAARLAEAGLSVLVLEAGPFFAEAELPRGEGAAFRDLFLDRGTTSTVDLGITILAGYWSRRRDDDQLDDRADRHPIGCVSEWAADHGLTGFDGPEADADLARLARELDLQPPTAIPPKDRVILDGAAVLGWEAAPNVRATPVPALIAARAVSAARTATSAPAPRAHLATAGAAGARLMADAAVPDRVDWRGGTGRRRQRPPHTGRGRAVWAVKFVVRASQVVMAAGGLRTPLLLQASGLGPSAARSQSAVASGGRRRGLDVQAGHRLAGSVPGRTIAGMVAARIRRSADGIGPAHGGFVIESGSAASRVAGLGAAVGERRARDVADG